LGKRGERRKKERRGVVRGRGHSPTQKTKYVPGFDRVTKREEGGVWIIGGSF